MITRVNALPLLALFIALRMASAAADEPDYSREPLVVQNMRTTVKFASDGTSESRETLSVLIQSEAAVRQFGVLAFSYRADNEQLSVGYIHVKKKDGSVVDTPDASILDVASEVAASAPTYTDLRQKQIPVKGLGLGDLLEYSLLRTQKAPEISGQFWYDHQFITDNVVLNETLEIRVPKEKYVQISSPELKADAADQANERVYVWKHCQLAPTDSSAKKKPAVEPKLVRAQLTTFKNWEEVGDWWQGLVSRQTEATPAVREKAKQLTGGLASDAEKERAIYNYVSTKFRYISISLGSGRYLPHSAAEVLANQYGDCKDKHVLLASLLRASGIQAWPALIGVGIKFDASMPSPAQFNHVITVIPQDRSYLWLDTTAEVAPFGLLNRQIRDEQALVVPDKGKPFLLKTPADPPFTESSLLFFMSSINSDGILSGHFMIHLQNDDAVAFRAAFRQLPAAQWQPLVQQLSYAQGYSGDVSSVQVEDIDDLDKPLYLDYQYRYKAPEGWEDQRISAPLPMVGLGPGLESEKPSERFWIGTPGTLTYRIQIKLPADFTADMPEDAKVSSDFADYTARYSTTRNGYLLAERTLVIKQSKLDPEHWNDYQKFETDIQAEQVRLIMLHNRPSLKRTPAPDHP